MLKSRDALHDVGRRAMADNYGSLLEELASAVGLAGGKVGLTHTIGSSDWPRGVTTRHGALVH